MYPSPGPVGMEQLQSPPGSLLAAVLPVGLEQLQSPPRLWFPAGSSRLAAAETLQSLLRPLAEMRSNAASARVFHIQQASASPTVLVFR